MDTMQSFKGTVKGQVRLEGLDASNERIDEDSLLSGVIDGYGEYRDANIIEAEVTIEFEFVEHGVECEDPENFDAEAYIESAISTYATVRISNYEFEVTEGPEAFDVIMECVDDNELAMSIYSALQTKGLLA